MSNIRNNLAYAGIGAAWSLLILVGVWFGVSGGRFDIRTGLLLPSFLFTSVAVGFLFRAEFSKDDGKPWFVGTAVLALNALFGTLWAFPFSLVLSRAFPSLLPEQDLHWSLPMLLFGGWTVVLSNAVWIVPLCAVVGFASFHVMKQADKVVMQHA